MCGAAALTSEGAYRAGAGLVTLACPSTLVPVLSTKQTCAVVRPLPDTGDGHLGAGAWRVIDELAQKCDVIAIGPGLGSNPQAREEVRMLVPTSSIPLVIDADGLNAFTDEPELLARGDAARILTPHPGELERLVPEVENREAWAREAAGRFHALVVLKGHHTIVTDGARTYVNKTGNPGMATGGSGDVLTGIIAALLGQKLEPYDAACLGVYIHGLAGDLAARELGEISMMATDLLDYLPMAFKKGAKP